MDNDTVTFIIDGSARKCTEGKRETCHALLAGQHLLESNQCYPSGEAVEALLNKSINSEGLDAEQFFNDVLALGVYIGVSIAKGATLPDYEMYCKGKK